MKSVINKDNMNNPPTIMSTPMYKTVKKINIPKIVQ